MKTTHLIGTILCAVIMWLLLTVQLNACSIPQRRVLHKEHVHQYIVQEAYRFLEHEVGEISVLKDYLGVNYWGSGPSVNPWNNDEAIAIGVWQEDLFDALYGNMGLASSCVSGSHFWNADDGDNATSNIGVCGSFPNAFTKSMNYFGGADRNSSFVFTRDAETQMPYGGGWIYTLGARYRYSNLCNFTTSGSATLVNVVDLLGRVLNYNKSVTMDNQVRRQYGFNLLGRILHLLGDMSVPAHTLVDIHPCGLNDPEYYELWMGSNENGDCNYHHQNFTAQNWTRNGARVQGGLMLEVFNMSDADAIRYLFYNLNQLTNHFPSSDFQGNNNLPNGTTLTLNARYNEFGNPPQGVNVDVNCNQIADETFKYCIRATATMMYWFAAKIGLADCPDVRYLQSERYYGARTNTEQSTISSSQRIFTGKDVRTDIVNASYTVESPARLALNAGNSINLRSGTRVKSGSVFNAKITSVPCQLASTTCNFQANAIQLKSDSLQTQTTILDTVSSVDIYLYNGWTAETSDSVSKYTNWYFYKERSGDYIVRNDTTKERPNEYAVYADTTRILDENENLLRTISKRSLVRLKRNLVEINSDGTISYTVPSNNSNDVLLSPLPNTDRITLTGLAVSHVEIMTMSGEVVMSTKLTEPTLSTASLPSGTYYIRCTTTQGIVVKPFVIVR